MSPRSEDWSLKALLSLGLGLMGALIVALGAAAWLGLGALDQRLGVLLREQVPRQALVVGLEREVREMGRSLRNELLWTDIREIKREAVLLQAGRQRLEAGLQALEAQPLDAEGRSLLAELRQAGQRYLKLQRRFEDLINAGSGDDGRDLMKGELVQAETAFQASVLRLLQIETTAVRTAADAATQSAARQRQWLALGAVAAMAMALALALWLLRALTRPLRLALGLARSVAEGDLRHGPRFTGRSETAQLLQALNEMQRSLAGVVGEVRQQAQQLALASHEIAQGNQDLSQRTEQQAAALQQLSSAMTQLGSGARGSAADAERASRRAADASGVAERGGAVMDEVVSTMRGIADSARRIAEITGLIDGIAARTNMLALNAAVEAARAGEQGRGFAVVASEVRALAQRSADASRSIAELIQASDQRVQQGSSLVLRAGSTMHELVSAIGDVSKLVAGISQSSAAQSSGVALIGESLVQLDQGTQQNAALVEQGAAASMALQQQAQGLLQAVATFQLAEPEIHAAAPSDFSHSSGPVAAAFARQELP